MCGWFAKTFRRDFCQTLYMFGTHHCCYSSSLCLSENHELAPASAGAERRTLNIECVVRALRPTSDVACPAVTWRILPTIARALPQIWGRRNRKFSSIRGWLPTRRRQRNSESTRFHQALEYTTQLVSDALVRKSSVTDANASYVQKLRVIENATDDEIRAVLHHLFNDGPQGPSRQQVQLAPSRAYNFAVPSR